MIFSYNWLREFVELPQDPSELAKIMTFGGIEVEGYHSPAEQLKEIIIVKIVKVEKHPDADKLHVCLIDTGSTTKQVICGAPNCQQDMLTAYAPVGVKLGNRTIERVNIRSVESEGMLCSESELGISEDHSGILSLPQDAPLGKDLRSYLDISDTIFEVEITPNRPDLLGILGLARDVAALTKKALHLPDRFPTDGYIYPPGFLSTITADNVPFNLTNEATNLCPRYIAQVITGVKVKESPNWLKRKLMAVGITPINNIVDITNYVMMEFGHPLHAFDYSLLEGKQIRVRRAQKGETISALDHKDYVLLEDDLVIADGTKPVAIAGIIGGKNSAISPATHTIVLEAANFSNLSIRHTAARLKINTDSSYRFERNLSDETVALISQRAADLITELCQGEVVVLRDSYPSPNPITEIGLRAKRANELLTTELSNHDIWEYLRPLGLIANNISNQKDCETISEEQTITFTIPPYRKDLAREIDLIEEIIRLHGYNNIPEKPERETITDLDWFYTKREIADYLVHNGFYEAINSSFSEPAILKTLALAEDDYRTPYFELINPLGASFSIMRTSLLPGLLKNVQFNLSNGQTDIKLFELGKVFLKQDDKPAERYFLAGAVVGNINKLHWKYKTDRSSIFAVKGYVEGLVSLITDNQVIFQPTEMKYYQQESAIDILVNGQKVGNLGKFDPLLAKKLEIENALFLFDIDISQILQCGIKKSPVYQEINRYPAVIRDISFIIDKKFEHQSIDNTIRSADRDVIKNITLIDEFTGKNIQAGYRSLTYSIIFNSNQGTLTDEFVNNSLQEIKSRLEKEYKIEMR
ncbi:MAG: phenylalanine--tRNA ligase subunit beta [Candidatus Cloacimonetes bacterium]|nr:phenylalanine--tRNA ligase subunit beta [Candidatus Cloacimonadota bacterium]